MAKGKKTSIKDKAKVIQAKILDPNKSTRDIEQETWVNYRTNARIIEEDLSQVVTESQAIAKMIDDNEEILLLTGKEIKRKLTEWILSDSSIVASRKLALEQNRLVQWEATSREELNIVDSQGYKIAERFMKKQANE